MITNIEAIEEVSVGDFVKKIRAFFLYSLKKFTIILTCSIMGLSAGVFYAYFKKPIYTAECSFVLEEGDKGGGLGAYSGLASMVGIDLGRGGGLFQGDNIIQLYQSRSMIVKTLLSYGNFDKKTQLLINRYIEFNRLRPKWRKEKEIEQIDFTIPPQMFTIKHDSILTEISNSLKKGSLSVVKPDKKLSIISVTVTSTDQQFAKVFNEKLVENVNTFYVETKTKKGLQNFQILQHQTDSVKRELNNALLGVAYSNEANPNANPLRQVIKVPAQKKTVEVEANRAILQELVKNLEVSKVTLRKDAPLIQIIDSPIYPLKKDKVGKIKGGLSGLFIGLILSFSYLAIRFLGVKGDN